MGVSVCLARRLAYKHSAVAADGDDKVTIRDLPVCLPADTCRCKMLRQQREGLNDARVVVLANDGNVLESVGHGLIVANP